MKAKTIYVTDDGMQFEDETAAAKHEAILGMKDSIAAFLEIGEYADRRASEYARIIEAWEGFKADRDEKQTEIAAVA